MNFVENDIINRYQIRILLYNWQRKSVISINSRQLVDMISKSKFQELNPATYLKAPKQDSVCAKEQRRGCTRFGVTTNHVSDSGTQTCTHLLGNALSYANGC